jgi:hypothetical protein
MTSPLYSKSENKERIKEIELLRRLKARDQRTATPNELRNLPHTARL